MKLCRSLAVISGLAMSVVATVGLAMPASAAYTNEPLSRAWVADGPVHSSLGTSTSLFVGGLFAGSGGVAMVDPATGGANWILPTNGDVRALALSSDGNTLFAGGNFTTVAGAKHLHLVAINVSDGSVIPTWKASASGSVRDLVVSGDTLYVAGTFKTINGFTEKGLGALTASTGVRISGFTHFTDKNVWGLALTPTSLIAVGNFTTVDGVGRSSMASFNLSTYAMTSWAPYRLCSGCTSYWDIVVDGTNAYVGTSGNVVGAYNLVTGSNPWRYVRTDGDVQALALTGDGLLYIGGHFGQYVGSSSNPRTILAAINPANGAVDPNFHPRFYATYPGIWTLTSTPGRLYGGGDFKGVGIGPNEANNKVPYLAAFGVL
ncbi:MAG: PQQ-binding-like beta-propeller repeat protein [Nocardioidaceae bacterium]